jgi:hypothetical protein
MISFAGCVDPTALVAMKIAVDVTRVTVISSSV